MFVAEVKITDGSGLWSTREHIVSFTDIDAAKAEYARLKDLLERKLARKNDLPASVEIVADGTTITMAADHIAAVSLFELAILEPGTKEAKEAFPNLFRKAAE